MSIIRVVSKPYKDLNVIENIVAYALRVPVESLNKNISNVKYISYGVNDLTPRHMVNSFYRMKDRFNKRDGKQLHHFILSIYKRNYTGTENKKQWADIPCSYVGQYLKELGFQNISFTHVNEYDTNVHVHFVMNSVNGITGLKLSNEKTFYNDLLSYLRTNFKILKWEFVTYD